jgi:hypothetical protein
MLMLPFFASIPRGVLTELSAQMAPRFDRGSLFFHKFSIPSSASGVSAINLLVENRAC